jgi:soluble lytic murein transglycosylase-like protein
VAAGTLLLVCGIVSAEEPLLYVVEGDAVVFTNTPQPGTRPVPGLSDEPTPTAPRLAPTRFDPYIERVARETGLQPELIKAVALVESGFDARAVSRAGAQGLMQLMPQTARDYGVADAFDPLANLQAGARHLRDLLDQFQGDLTLALAAYNAGAGAVRRHDGVPDYPETVDYVRRVHEKLGREARGMPPPVKTPARPIRFRVLDDGSVLLTN